MFERVGTPRYSDLKVNYDDYEYYERLKEQEKKDETTEQENREQDNCKAALKENRN